MPDTWFFLFFFQLEEEEERREERRREGGGEGGVVKSPSDLSCSSYELFVGQEKGIEEKDTKERASIRSAEGESLYDKEKARINNKMRKVSPFPQIIFLLMK